MSTQSPRIDASRPNSLLSTLCSAYQWLHQKGYAQGVFWAVAVCLVSSLNDVFTRFAGSRMDFFQVAWFRFMFSTLTLLPVMLYFNRSTFFTNKPGFQAMRAILGYGAVACWVAGVSMTELSIASIMAQTVGLFVLVMAYVILGERVGLQRTLATLAGMSGILIILLAPKEGSSFTMEALSTFDLPVVLVTVFNGSNLGIYFLLAASIMFAASDILNKIMVAQEHPLTMLFYFALGTSLIGLIPAIYVWQTPQLIELFWLFCLGAGANLILFCLLKAFAATEISALQPYRYVEIFFATGFGFALFGEVPTLLILVGAAIIIPSTLTIALYETRQKKS